VDLALENAEISLFCPQIVHAHLNADHLKLPFFVGEKFLTLWFICQQQA